MVNEVNLALQIFVNDYVQSCMYWQLKIFVNNYYTSINDTFVSIISSPRSQEVCLELNLLTGMSFHEKLADITINEEEQAR